MSQQGFTGQQPPFPPPLPQGAPPDASVAKLIPYKNAPALISYYLGIFSAIPVLGILLGIAAIVMGIIGLVMASRRPEIRGKVHAWVGICTELTLHWLVIGLIILLIGK